MTTRRNFLWANLIGAAGLAAGPSRMFAEEAESATGSAPARPTSGGTRSDRDFWNDWPAYVTAEMNRARSRRLAELASVHSTTEAEKRAARVRAQLWDLIGGPPSKTALHARVTGTLDRDGYRIEKLVFESFPKVYVTADLYLPVAGKPPYPTILSPVGHSDNGKAYHSYQQLYQNLARKGYVVLTYDPFGQGERLQYIDPKTGRSLYGPTGEHSQAGRPMVLMGETLALYLAWDGMRGVDYLVTRPEVDAKRLGCVGQSGGGTMTMYLAALEPRLQAAVVCEGNTENVAGPYFDPPGATDDAEQNIVGSLPKGLDRGDLLLAFAPKPLLICYTTHDEGVTYSPVYEESTTHIYRELQRVYGMYGVQQSVGLYATHLPHGMDYFERTQTYAWFNRWLQNPAAGDKDEALDVFPEKLLDATRTGQVLTSLGGRSVVQLNADRARVITEESPFVQGSISAAAEGGRYRDTLTSLLALPAERTPLHSRVRSVNARGNAVMEEIQFESELGMRIPGWFARSPSSTGRRPTILYLTDTGGDDLVAEPGSMDRVLAAGTSICTISLRGLWITMPRFPNTGGPLYYEDGSVLLAERMAWTCLVLGKPVIGQRVWDTLRAIDYLASRPDVDGAQIRIVGVGGAGLAAMMATFLDDRVRSILVNRTLARYMSIMDAETYTLPLGWFVPGILRNFDLPDIAAGIGPRPCWILNGVDPDGKVLTEASLREQYSHRIGKGTELPATMRLLAMPQAALQETCLEWLQST